MKTLTLIFTLVLFAAFLAMLATPAFAQGTTDATVASGIPGLSAKQGLWVTWGIMGFKWLAELYGSVRNGGGLKRIVTSFWLGEQTPKVIADDYKAELSKPPFQRQ